MKTTSQLMTVLFAMLFCAADVNAQSRVDAPMVLEKASHARMVEGDLSQAISLYRQVAMSATASRNHVARALVELGNTYELQGSPEAVPTYERVVSEFSDQPASFMLANAKLSTISLSSSVGPDAAERKGGGDYMLVLGELPPSMARNPRRHDFSADGSMLLFVSEPGSERQKLFPDLRREIYIRDTSGSLGRPLIENAEDWEYIGQPRWSPDGKYIFYILSIGDGERRFMLLDFESQTSRQLMGDFLKLDRSMFDSAEWMPDSKGLVIQSQNGFRIIGLDGVEKKHFPGKVAHVTRMGNVSPDGRFLLMHMVTANKEDHAEMDIWKLDLESGQYSEVTNDAGFEGWPVWSTDGTQIYYVSGPEAARNVYRRKPGSDEPPVKVTSYTNSSAIYPGISPKGGQLSFALAKDNNVVYSAKASTMDTSTTVVRGSNAMLAPDGKYIYYLDDQPGNVGLWRISFNGDNPQQLVPGKVLTSYGPKSLLSPDGSSIAYSQYTGDSTTLYVMPSGGGEATSLYSADGVRHLIPSWSPDSNEIAFSIDGDLMVIPAKGGATSVLASVKNWESWNLEWSPDGKFIAGFAYLEGEESNHIMKVDRALKEVTRVTPPEEDQYKEILAWHPDGNRISYMYYNSEDHNGTRVVDMETLKITDLVNMPDPNWDYMGAWGPDKRYYFLSTGRGTGHWGLYSFDESKGNYEKIRKFSDRAMSLPSWSADGSLMVWSEKEPVRQIWMMTDYE